jgi:hypothetical protein
MTTIKAFIKSHALLSYFVLAFAVSWGGIIIAIRLGPGGFSAAVANGGHLSRKPLQRRVA